jgi:hypothetical protein
MPCPECDPSNTNHRACLIKLFREKKIKTIEEWKEMCKKPKTIIKGKVTIKIKKGDE